MKGSDSMKTLILYNNSTGELVFTQTNANENYACRVVDITEDKEVIGFDISANKIITADRLATHNEKEALKLELLQKNEEINRIIAKNESMNNNLKNNIKALESQKEVLTDELIDLKAENLTLKMGAE